MSIIVMHILSPLPDDTATLLLSLIIRGCSLLPDDIMVLSCYNSNTVSFINTEGVELFQISENKTGAFSICFTAKYCCRSDAYFFMLTIFVWYSVSSFCFSSRDDSSSRDLSVRFYD
jgi:hypothetical protein